MLISLPGKYPHGPPLEITSPFRSQATAKVMRVQSCCHCVMETARYIKSKSSLQACTGQFSRCPWRLSNQCERLQKERLHSETSRRKLYIHGLPAVFTHLSGLHTQLSEAYHRRSDDLRSLRLDYVTLGPGESPRTQTHTDKPEKTRLYSAVGFQRCSPDGKNLLQCPSHIVI